MMYAVISQLGNNMELIRAMGAKAFFDDLFEVEASIHACKFQKV